MKSKLKSSWVLVIVLGLGYLVSILKGQHFAYTDGIFMAFFLLVIALTMALITQSINFFLFAKEKYDSNPDILDQEEQKSKLGEFSQENLMFYTLLWAVIVGALVLLSAII